MILYAALQIKVVPVLSFGKSLKGAFGGRAL